MSVVLRIHGVPTPQGNKSAFVRNGKAVVVEGRRGPARAAHAAWRQAVATAARDHLDANPWQAPFTDACVVFVTFLLPRPKSVSVKRRPWPTVKPDVDKLLRSLLDGLTDGGLLRDDTLVVRVEVEKAYAADDEPTGARVTIQPRTLAGAIQ